MPDTFTVTLLFGGENRERLVSVASAQAVARALPEADIWFWGTDGHVYRVSPEALAKHERPFETAFTPDGPDLGTVDTALDLARDEGRVLVLALHGGAPENGEFQVRCELRGVAFTGSGSASSNLAFDKTRAKVFAATAGIRTPLSVSLADAEDALAEYGKLVAKPAQDGSSYGLFFVNSTQDLVAVRNAAKTEAYLIEPYVKGLESTCGVLEQADGTLIALPPVEIIPADGAFDYKAKYLASGTQEICPATFAPEINATLQDLAIKAHKALSCRGYSRSDFIISDKEPIYLETNTLPGLTAQSLYPKSLKAQGIEFVDFLKGQIDLAVKRARG